MDFLFSLYENENKKSASAAESLVLIVNLSLHASLMTHSSSPTGPQQSLVVSTTDYKGVFGGMCVFSAVVVKDCSFEII